MMDHDLQVAKTAMLMSPALNGISKTQQQPMQTAQRTAVVG